MLMTRFLYLASSLLVLFLNGAALWYALSHDPAPARIEVAALVVNAVIWPLAIVIAYRIGQATGRLHFARTHRGQQSRPLSPA